MENWVHGLPVGVGRDRMSNTANRLSASVLNVLVIFGWDGFSVQSFDSEFEIWTQAFDLRSFDKKRGRWHA